MDQEERFDTFIFENVPVGIFKIAPEGRIILANTYFARVLGYDSPRELIQNINHSNNLWPSGSWDIFKNTVESNGVIHDLQFQLLKKDHTPISVSLTARAVMNKTGGIERAAKDPEGNILYFEGTVIDITDKKLTEQALAESEELYRTAIENSNDGVTITKDDVHEYVNDKFLSMFGYRDRNEIVGKSIYAATVHPDDRQMVIDYTLKRQNGEDVPSRYEFKGLRKDGSEISVEVSATRILYRGGPACLAYFREITEKKRAEIILRKMEDAIRTERDKFRLLSENAPIGIVLINANGEFDHVNPKFEHIFGYTLSDVPTGKEWFRKAYPDNEYRHQVVSTWKNNFNWLNIGEEKPWTFNVTCKDGQQKTIHFIPVRLETGGFIMTCDDVTEQIAAQESVRHSEQTLKAILSTSPVGIALINDSTIAWANDAACHMTGYDHDELNRIDPRVLFLGEEDWSTAKNQLRHNNEAETQWVRKDRSIIDVKLRTARLKDQKDMMIAVAADITDQKLAFQAMAQSRDELNRLNRVKTKALDHLSHELKTPLAITRGSLRIIKKKLNVKYPDNSIESLIDNMDRNLERLLTIQQEAEKIIDASERLNTGNVLDDLERLWRKIEDSTGTPPDILSHWNALKIWMLRQIPRIPVAKRRINIEKYFQSAIDKARRSAADRQIDYDMVIENDPYILMNPEMFKDILDGILKNAVENTPDGGTIEIRAKKEENKTVIQFQDTGIGITQENQRFIFDGLYHTENTNLYSSKRPYQFGAGGKALDLFRVKMYAQRFGFTIGVESKRCPNIISDDATCPGNLGSCNAIPQFCIHSGGTTFTLQFPV